MTGKLKKCTEDAHHFSVQEGIYDFKHYPCDCGMYEVSCHIETTTDEGFWLDTMKPFPGKLDKMVLNGRVVVPVSG